MKFSKKILISSFAGIFILSLVVSGPSVLAQTQTLTMPTGVSDPTQSSFRIVICDGPTLPSDPTAKAALIKGAADPNHYIPCDFNGAMMQVQHLIDICMVLGVFAAIALFTYAGYLFMTGKEGDRKKAYEVFPRVFWGFIIMLSAWFIVYQILSWLTGNSMFTKLLGN